jgi:F0F1-type ATP synthase membrane subunit b/b'
VKGKVDLHPGESGTIFPIIRGGSEDDSTSEAGDETSGGTDDATEGVDSGSDDGEKKFTQKEVNDLIAREVSKKTRGKFDPSELGYKSKKELEDAIAQAKTVTDEAKSEQEQALEKAKQDAAKEATDTVLSEANSRLIRAEFKLGAVEHKIAYPDDALAIARTMELWKEVSVDDEGTVQGLDDTFWDEFKKLKPHLVAAPGAGAASADVGAGAGGGKKAEGEADSELREKYPYLKRLTGNKG